MTAALLLLASPAALAYWELRPQVEAGMTYETNPRYIADQSKAALEALAPGITDSVLGTYIDLRATAAYQTTTDQLSIAPRIRKTDYLKSNKDLNDDDWYVVFAANHAGSLGRLGLTGNYAETGVRTSEFESATPSDPNSPPPINGGSGRFSDTTQQTWELRPSLAYAISPRNLVSVTADYSDTSYDQRQRLITTAGYLDYHYSSVDVSIRHILNAKNQLSLTLNGGNFAAQQPGTVFRNSTDSFGITGGYEYKYSESLTVNGTAGVSRNSVNVSGIVGGFDSLTGAPCTLLSRCTFRSEERNFVGDIGLQKRSELTTLNFSIGRAIAPRSDGTEVVQDELRLYLDQTLSQRLSGSLGGIYRKETAVGKIFQPDSGVSLLARQDRTYFTVDARLTYRLTKTLSTYATYSYTSDKNDVTSSNVEETNNRLFFGVLYSGIGLRR